MSKFFLNSRLSKGKQVILNELFNARANEMAEGKDKITIKEKERFLDIVTNVSDESLKKELIYSYLADDDKMGEECARLIEHYYKNGVSDGVNLILECVGGIKK